MIPGVAWEWVAPVVTGTLGVVGIAATWSAQQISRNHSTELAQFGRTQDRRQAVYERILLTALKTTEFVEGADLIWIRNAMPPDVDAENFDMWVLTDLHTTHEFRTAYGKWLDTVDATREIGDELDEDENIWEQDNEFQERYLTSSRQMRKSYELLVKVARDELYQVAPSVRSRRRSGRPR